MQTAGKLAAAELASQFPLDFSLLALNFLRELTLFLSVHKVLFMDDNIMLVDASMNCGQIDYLGHPSEMILVPGWTHSVMIASKVAAVLSGTSTRKLF